MTALDIIKAAFRVVGVASTGNPLSSEDAANGLEALQIMLGKWLAANLSLFCYKTQEHSCVVGTAEYTVGSTGDIAITRPDVIEKIYIKDSNNLDFPMTEISATRYASITDKTKTGRPTYWWYNPTYLNGTLTVWPVPNDSSDTLVLVVLQRLAVPDQLTDDLDFPTVYQSALKWCLAVELAPEYGVDLHPYVTTNADRSFALLQQNNALAQITPVTLNLPAGMTETYNIEEG